MNQTVATARRPPAVVLLVEDDRGDQLLTQEAFQTVRVPHELRIVGDGEEALDYLYRRGDFVSEERAPRPDLILLDLNMPRLSGREVAQRIRHDPAMQDIPIVVLTTSRREEDVLQSYGQGVTSFLTKPLDFEEFLSAVRNLEDLLRFLVGLKSLRQRASLSVRQTVRMLRRQQQLERLAEELFDRHMSQFRRPPEPAPSLAEEPTREATVRVVQKILDSIPATRRAEAPLGGPPALSQAGSPEGSGTATLAELARALEREARPAEAPTGQPAAGPAPPERPRR